VSIETAIQNVQAHALSLEGIKSAPTKVLESNAQLPFAVTYERTGTSDIRGEGWLRDLCTIFCEIHVSRQVLSLAIDQAMGFRDPFLRLLRDDPKLGNSIDTIVAIRRTFGYLEYANTQTLGYRFEIDVKIQITD
jgi:hypothetical protein